MRATACPVDGCTSGQPANPALVVSYVGPNNRVAVATCARCARRIGEGREPVSVEYRPPLGRWPRSCA